ncbi:glycine C-acetyltransferase [soil metagenome]
MAAETLLHHLKTELESIKDAGMYKEETVIESAQGATITTTRGEMVNFCANNYLGLANDPAILDAAIAGLDNHGFGMASVRFICGTQDLHKQLEQRISEFLQTEDTILYNSCFDANGGLFETILGPDDVIISDALNHASIIDGVRLAKSQRKVYQHVDMADLKIKLEESRDNRFRLIVTDGAFSMHGDLAPLDQLCGLADAYEAIVVVDDSHATGFIGEGGRGTPEHFGVMDRVDLITSTLGKALGGAAGGFTSGRREIVEMLRQRSRPYLFSNALPPPIAMATMTALDIVEQRPELRQRLMENTAHFREQIQARGFTILQSIHPIVPIVLGDERKTVEMAEKMNDRGFFVVGFSYPVVPKGQARVRVQISAAHTREQIDAVLNAFAEVAAGLGAIPSADGLER